MNAQSKEALLAGLALAKRVAAMEHEAKLARLLAFAKSRRL